MITHESRCRSIVLADERSHLAGICRPEAFLAVHPRSVDPRVRAYVERVLVPHACRIAGDDLESFFQGLPDAPGCDAFREDLRWQAELFRSLTGAARVQLKVESVTSSLCERFHVDRVGLRLICSYAGPGTEWLEDADVNRAKLGPGSGGLPDEESGLLRDGAGIHRMPPYAVGLMKGSLWPGCAGLVHRSPRMSGSTRRVLFKIDALI